MKINTRTVWQMTDDGMHIIEQDSYEHDGPVSQCFGGSSSSTTASTTTNQQLIETETTNLSDFEGIGVADARDVQIHVTDQEAIRQAGDVAIESLDVVGDAVGDAFEFGGDALDFGSETVRRSLEAVEGTVDQGFDANQRVIDRGFDFGGDVFDKSISTLGDITKRTGETLTSAISQVASASRSDAADVLNNLVKFGAIAIGVTVLAVAVIRR